MLSIPRRSRLTVNYLCEEIATTSGRLNDCADDCWKVFCSHAMMLDRVSGSPIEHLFEICFFFLASDSAHGQINIGIAKESARLRLVQAYRIPARR